MLCSAKLLHLLNDKVSRHTHTNGTDACCVVRPKSPPPLPDWFANLAGCPVPPMRSLLNPPPAKPLTASSGSTVGLAWISSCTWCVGQLLNCEQPVIVNGLPFSHEPLHSSGRPLCSIDSSSISSDPSEPWPRLIFPNLRAIVFFFIFFVLAHC